MLGKRSTALAEQGDKDEDTSGNKKEAVGGWIPMARPAKRVLRLACGVQGNQPPAVSVLREQTSLSVFPKQSGKDDNTSTTTKATFGGCLPLAW